MVGRALLAYERREGSGVAGIPLAGLVACGRRQWGLVHTVRVTRSDVHACDSVLAGESRGAHSVLRVAATLNKSGCGGPKPLLFNVIKVPFVRRVA